MLQSNTRPAANSFPFAVLNQEEITALYCRLSQDDKQEGDSNSMLATLQANAERKPKVQFKQDAIGKLIDIQSRMTEGKGIGYKRWLTKHNLKVMAQTVKLRHRRC